jgi:hypothetical protein
MVWRRVLVSSSIGLLELHGILQAEMGGRHSPFLTCFAAFLGDVPYDVENRASGAA